MSARPPEKAGQDIREVSARVPGWEPQECEFVEKLSGSTNRVYKIARNGSHYVLRFCRNERTAQLAIDRAMEHEALKAADQTAVGPSVVAYLLPEGHMVARWIDGVTLQREELRSPRTMLEVAKTLVALHQAPKIQQIYSPFLSIKHHATQLSGMDHRLRTEVDALLPVCRRVEQVTRRSIDRLSLCHNDIYRRNMLDCGSLRLIDWEFGGMNDPLFDLACYARTANLSSLDELFLLRSYHRLDPLPERLLLQFARMKFVHCMREALWGLVRAGWTDTETTASATGETDRVAHYNRLAWSSLEAAKALADDVW